MKNFISIIIPVYNSEKYISRCLDSILRQSYKKFEIIIIDDGSTDNSYKIMENYYKKYPEKIRIFTQKNFGVAVTRNKGIKVSTGEYIMFIDNDDFIDFDYLSTFIFEIKKNKCDIVVGGYKRPNSENKIIEKVSLRNNQLSKLKILAPWAKIFKKQYLVENSICFLECNIGDDVYFNFNAMTFTNKIKIINYIGYNWYYNEKSVSNVAHRKMSDKLEFNLMLDNCFEIMNNKKFINKNYEILEFCFLKQIIWYLFYSSKNVNYDYIIRKYKELIKWMDIHFNYYKNNKYIKYGNDNFMIIFSLKIILVVDKYNLEGVFFKVYKFLFK